jgi:UDP-glucuronate 4-epimerase
VRSFVFASSSSVYGNSTPLPAREEACAIEPESPYAASKRGAELAARAICLREPRLACTALRFFTVYGPRQRPEMAMTRFARALMASKPITVFGDGTMQRDFTHVEDIVAGILAAAANVTPGWRIYNLGSGAPIDLGALVALLAGLSGRSPEVLRASVPLGDVQATFADISRAKVELGWAPRVALRDGLQTVLDWVSAHP